MLTLCDRQHIIFKTNCTILSRINRFMMFYPFQIWSKWLEMNCRYLIYSFTIYWSIAFALIVKDDYKNWNWNGSSDWSKNYCVQVSVRCWFTFWGLVCNAALITLIIFVTFLALVAVVMIKKLVIIAWCTLKHLRPLGAYTWCTLIPAESRNSDWEA